MPRFNEKAALKAQKSSIFLDQNDDGSDVSEYDNEDMNANVTANYYHDERPGAVHHHYRQRRVSHGSNGGDDALCCFASVGVIAIGGIAVAAIMTNGMDLTDSAAVSEGKDGKNKAGKAMTGGKKGKKGEEEDGDGKVVENEKLQHTAALLEEPEACSARFEGALSAQEAAREAVEGELSETKRRLGEAAAAKDQLIRQLESEQNRSREKQQQLNNLYASRAADQRLIQYLKENHKMDQHLLVAQQDAWTNEADKLRQEKDEMQEEHSKNMRNAALRHIATVLNAQAELCAQQEKLKHSEDELEHARVEVAKANLLKLHTAQKKPRSIGWTFFLLFCVFMSVALLFYYLSKYSEACEHWLNLSTPQKDVRISQSPGGIILYVVFVLCVLRLMYRICFLGSAFRRNQCRILACGSQEELEAVAAELKLRLGEDELEGMKEKVQ